MAEKSEALEDEIWKKFLKKHWKMSILIVIGIVITAICAFLVFLWFKDYAQVQAIVPVPAYIEDWSVGIIVGFILRLIFWEFIIIGIPVIAAAGVIFLQWWNKLPEEEKEEYKSEPKKKGPRRGITAGSGGGLFSFLVLIAWLIIVYAGGMWDTTFQFWTLNYLVSTWIWAIIWILIICGIPIALFVIFWLRRELKKES